MTQAKRYLITSALPYANGALHLGHLAGAYLPADIYVRYLRAMEEDVVWVCGSDEHGAAITIRAKKEETSPQAIIDKYHFLNKESFARLGISFDIYHRTSEQLHHETSQEFFLELNQQGDQFEKRTTEQYYDAEFDQFLADRYIKGTCPKCGYEEAFGDQCENCGSDLSPIELINPVSTLSGNTPVLKETTHWYFKLDKHQEWLQSWIETGQLDEQAHHDASKWKKHVIGQCLSWLKEGLHPRSITRDLSWGIPVPLEGAEGKVLYVWFDAPIGYISATKQWASDHGKDWEDYWKDEESRLIHFVGKDNIVFHCIIFPAMLKSYPGYVLPQNVPANQFLNFEGQKFSKSKGIGIELHEYLEDFKDFPNKEDAIRWALVRNLPENKDADFKWDDFIEYHDKELADKLGNFINRVVVLSHKYFAGTVPTTTANIAEILSPVKELSDRLCAEIEAFSFKAAAQTFVEIASWGNSYLQDAAPWALFKENPEDPKIAEVMTVGLETVTLLSYFASLFLPFTAPRICQQLNLEEDGLDNFAAIRQKLTDGQRLLEPGHKIGKGEVLFPKIIDRKDDSRLQIIQQQKDKLATALAETTGPKRKEFKPEISFEDFTKLDLRTATIIAAEPVPKADKLLKLTVDLANEQRTVVSGIAQHYDTKEVIGRQVVLVCNLAPRKLRGVLSQGMILMAENEEGKLVFVSPDDGFGNGWEVR